MLKQNLKLHSGFQIVFFSKFVAYSFLNLMIKNKVYFTLSFACSFLLNAFRPPPPFFQQTVNREVEFAFLQLFLSENQSLFNIFEVEFEVSGII